MKIKPEHLDAMREAIGWVDNEAARERYKAAGLSKVRYQWDCLRIARFTEGQQPRAQGVPGATWICDVLYKYMDDTHIQSALNKVITTF